MSTNSLSLLFEAFFFTAKRCLNNANKGCRQLSLMTLLIGTCYINQSYAAVWIITYPQSEVENDSRHVYPLALLELALQKTSVRYELRPSPSTMRQGKALKRLEENLVVNVMWTMTDRQRESNLLPIRIPINRGLIGWRVFISNKSNPFLKAPINTINDLLAFSPVQGISWPDTRILQANGFNVITAKDYIEAADMVSNHHADFFPRSVIEVLDELKNEHSQLLMRRKGLAIYYPTAQYFFTNKQNSTLNKLIETGLRRALKDGSFEKLFNEHYGEVLETIALKDSTVFTLANPLLPILTPIGESEYWYTQQ